MELDLGLKTGTDTLELFGLLLQVLNMGVEVLVLESEAVNRGQQKARCRLPGYLVEDLFLLTSQILGHEGVGKVPTLGMNNLTMAKGNETKLAEGSQKTITR